jgi:hypothetical protein
MSTLGALEHAPATERVIAHPRRIACAEHEPTGTHRRQPGPDLLQLRFLYRHCVSLPSDSHPCGNYRNLPDAQSWTPSRDGGQGIVDAATLP